MFRTILSRSSRVLSVPSQGARVTSIATRSIKTPFVLHTAPKAFGFQALRAYSSSGALSKPEVESRITDLLKSFEKVTDETKITSTSHFSNDLGLDSLDTVEVVMAIEEEFSIEIPDKDADAIHSIEQAVTYILNQPDAK